MLEGYLENDWRGNGDDRDTLYGIFCVLFGEHGVYEAFEETIVCDTLYVQS